VRNTLLKPEYKPHFRSILDHLMTFSDELIYSHTIKNKSSGQINPKTRELLFDWIVDYLLTINSWMSNLDDSIVQA
jgi:hypothetical protein